MVVVQVRPSGSAPESLLDFLEWAFANANDLDLVASEIGHREDLYHQLRARLDHDDPLVLAHRVVESLKDTFEETYAPGPIMEHPERLLDLSCSLSQPPEQGSVEAWVVGRLRLMETSYERIAAHLGRDRKAPSDRFREIKRQVARRWYARHPGPPRA